MNEPILDDVFQKKNPDIKYLVKLMLLEVAKMCLGFIISILFLYHIYANGFKSMQIKHWLLFSVFLYALLSGAYQFNGNWKKFNSFF